MNIGYLNSFVAEHFSSDGAKSLKGLLEKHKCQIIYTDIQQNRKDILPSLNDAIGSLKPGDSLVVVELCHLASSLNQLVDIVVKIREQQSFLISLSEGIDTSKDKQSIFDSLSLFQRQATKIRTSHGLNAARARGLKGGRPGLSSEKIDLLNKLYESKKSISEICTELQITRSTLYKYLNR